MKLPTQTSPAMRTNKVSRISQIIKQESLIFASQSWPEPSPPAIPQLQRERGILSTIDFAREECRDLEGFRTMQPGYWRACLTQSAQRYMNLALPNHVRLAIREDVYQMINSM